MERNQKSYTSMNVRDITDMSMPLLGFLVAALLFWDAITTSLILGLGGYELNPVMIQIVQDPYVHLAFKILFAFLIVLISINAERKVPLSGSAFLCSIVVIYGIVIWNNVNVLLGFFLH